MKKTIFGFVLCSLAATACSGAESMPASEEAAEATGSSSEAITSTLPSGTTGVTYTGAVTIGSCLYQVGHGQSTTTLPPPYLVFVHKTALAASCAAPYGYQVIGTSYATPALSIAKGANNAIAASFTTTATPSGSAKKHAEIRRLDPATLAVQLSDSFAVPPGPITQPAWGNVYAASLAFTVPGDLLVVGTKAGPYPGELGGTGGTNYQATYAGFATTTTSAGPSQVLDW